MELTFTCPQCHTVGRAAAIETCDAIQCNHCHSRRELRAGSIVGSELMSCPWCATPDLYLQKDFPQGLGLLILVIGFAISTVFWYYQMPLWTFGVLLASVALDWWFYYRVGDVTICYRCLCQIRGLSAGGTRFRPFDLAVGERYRQERLRIEELQQARARGDSPLSG